MLNKNAELKKERGYSGKSYVRNDGSEVLYGKDWQRRSWELEQRCKGRCEYFVKCNARPDDAHHIIKRSKYRDDRLINLQALCRYHHNLIDNRKPKWRKRDE